MAAVAHDRRVLMGQNALAAKRAQRLADLALRDREAEVPYPDLPSLEASRGLHGLDCAAIARGLRLRKGCGETHNIQE